MNRRFFEEVAKREKVRPEEIIHIGDNQKSDVELAKKSGWNAIWYDTRQQIGTQTWKFCRTWQKNFIRMLHFGICWAEILQEICM